MRVIRWGLRIVVLVLVVALVGIGGLVGVVTVRGFPATTGSIQVEALHAPVTVVRDEHGILQIRADDPHDLFLAQGYVHAQERMWQMEVWRHISAGRLSELFGAGRVDTDVFIRTLGWRHAAQRDLDAMPEDVVAALEAYAEGVNAWLADNDGRLGTPFVVAGLLSGAGGLGGYTPEPWTPLDSAAWQKVQAWNLGGNMDTEIFRLLADTQLGDPALTDSLFPAYDGPVITPTGQAGDGGGTAVAPSRRPSNAAMRAVTAESAAAWRRIAELSGDVLALAGLDRGGPLAGDHGIGSNNWVVAGSKSASGSPLLANDPHLGFNMPSVWIMNGLHCREVSEACPFDVTGVSFPGVPAVVLGHNARIAWGATNVGPDVQDLFVETADPDDPASYRFDGESVPFEVRPETIKVAGGDDVVVEVRSTRHGPVISDVDGRLEDAAPVSLAWTSIREPDGAFTSIFRLNTAASFDDFRAALSGYGSPSQNFIYADIDGHIGYQLPGLIPVRDGAPTGDRVRDGASGEDEWTGYVPFEELPWQLDPASGVIVTANNAAVDADFPVFISNDWDVGDRAQRILDLIADASEGSLTTADFERIQADTYLLRAAEVVPAILAQAAPSTEDGRLLLDRLSSWDHGCGVESLGCAAFVTTEFMLTRALVEDELAGLARDWIGSGWSWRRVAAALADPADPWWDDVSTEAREDAATVVSAALDRTAAQLREDVGDPDSWTWGAIHGVDFREQSLGLAGIAPLNMLFNSGSRPVPGADGAVFNNYYQSWRAFPNPADPEFVPVGLDEAFQVTNGPSYRLAIDMADLDAARIVITTGNSGNPVDRHYADLIDEWAAGQTIPLPFTWAAVEASAKDTLTLEP